MGLEAVEIVMKLEDFFGIALADAEVEKIRTPGELIDLIASKIGRSDDATCLSQQAFHRLRASLMRRGFQRSEIRPDVQLEILFPRPTRKQYIHEVLSEAGTAKTIEFVRPKWLTFSILAITCVLLITPVIYFSHHPVKSNDAVVKFLDSQALFMGLIFAVLFMGTAFITTRPMCKEFASSMKNLGDFSRWLAVHLPPPSDAGPNKWSRQQIAEIVREVVIDILDCRSKYAENANFMKDLGMG